MNLAARLVAIVTATGTLLGGTTAAASAADLTVNSPEKVVVNQSYEWVNWRIGGPRKSALEDTFVNLEHRRSRALVDFDWPDTGELRGRFKVYDWDVQPGVHKVWLENAYDHNYNPMSTRPDYITIKFGSRASLSTARHGRKVTLHSRVVRWTDWSEWKPFRATTVRFQRKTPSGWKTVARDHANRRGVAQVTVRRKARAKYRAVALGTSGVWADRSPARRR